MALRLFFFFALLALGCGNPAQTVSYGGQEYKIVAIGAQIWMAENLNYNPGTGNSACYGNRAVNCKTYGRLYDWATAQTACPSGWHLPSQADWDAMTAYIGGSDAEGKKLKAARGWISCGPSVSGIPFSCEDAYGFSALPGGLGYSDGSFGFVGYYGHWWSASERTDTSAYGRRMGYLIKRANWDSSGKGDLLSVRCVKD